MYLGINFLKSSTTTRELSTKTRYDKILSKNASGKRKVFTMSSAHIYIAWRDTCHKGDKFRCVRIRLAARISRVHKWTKSAEGHTVMR